MIRRRVVFTVTDLTKVIDGVETVVTLDLDYNDGELAEADIALHAQDDARQRMAAGRVSRGVRGRRDRQDARLDPRSPGGEGGDPHDGRPRPGTPDYAQGWGPKVGWNDRAETQSIGTRSCVPVDCYQDVVVIREFNPDEPGAFQVKYYAPGVGGIRVGWAGKNEEEREVLRLVEFRRLTAGRARDGSRGRVGAGSAGIRDAPGAYGDTPPAS